MVEADSEQTMTMEIETNEFIPRDYQSEILEIAVQENTIVYLPTGSGIDKVNLMIFDECHQAVENQPMRQIMKLFENVPVDKQPRVVGLTATLLNRNCSPLTVQKVVRSLEMTFQSKVATVQDMAQIIGYSTNPEERITYFQSMVPDKVLQEAINMVTDIVDFASSVKWTSQKHSQTKIKQLIKLLRILVVHMEMLGIFGAWKSTFACIVSTERMKRHVKLHKNSLTNDVLTAITTKLCTVMALLEQTMACYSNKERIFKFSSPQVLMLIEILRAFRATNTNNLCGIVFVRQRFTAKVLFSVVKALAACSDEFSYIRTDFMVGSNANLGDKTTRELPYTAKVNKRIISNFYDGEINLLIASNVAEEGIDIPRCTLVVKFDRPMDYRSYIQSKGRARAGDSLYVIMVPVEESKYEESYQMYKAAQEELLQVRSTYAQFA
ncbi:Dicer-2 [Carabus blaptoides fortunei]